MTNYKAIMHHAELKMLKVRYFVSFFAFGFCLLFCRLVYLMFVFQWNNLNELVSMMEYIPCYYVYGECESWLLAMVDANAFGEWEDGVKKELHEAGLWWKKGGISWKRTKLYFKIVMLLCLLCPNNWGWMAFYGSFVLWLETCFPLCHEL